MDTITVTFPQVKINLPIEGLNFNTLKQAVFDITQAVGRKVLEEALIDIDKHLQETRPRGGLINTGKRPRYFLTRLGDIRYLRTRYTDKIKRYGTGCGASLKLKDKFTYSGIENGAAFMENLSLIAERRLRLSRANWAKVIKELQEIDYYKN